MNFFEELTLNLITLNQLELWLLVGFFAAVSCLVTIIVVNEVHFQTFAARWMDYHTVKLVLRSKGEMVDHEPYVADGVLVQISNGIDWVVVDVDKSFEILHPRVISIISREVLKNQNIARINVQVITI